MISNNPLIIGHRSVWGGEIPFVIHPEDARFHTYIIGKTGSGKTTLLRNLILQHIQQGHGIAIVDPHGDLAEELLHHLPSHRADHLVYFNPGDLDYPIAFNPLANVPPDDRPLVASGIVDAFKTIWGDSWGPRMAYILHNCIAALLDCQNSSLLGVNRMLIDPAYRRWVVKQVRDPFIKQFWQLEFESWDPRFTREAVAPIQNKVGALLQSPILRNILGQVKNKVSIPFVMDNQRIFIANLSKGRMGQDKFNLFGSLLVAQFQLAAMARSNQPESERVPFHLFVDEFQNFATDSFASILAEARKYRLSLTLSHQYIDQLTPAIRSAVFGNVGNLIAFRVGHTDAEILSNEFGNEFNPNTFVDLPRFHALAKMQENNEPQPTFKARLMPALEPNTGNHQKLIEKSRERFATRREEVEARINFWLR
jgi:energy-coupling factor transporter ATP-binding protein EcfA2